MLWDGINKIHKNATDMHFKEQTKGAIEVDDEWLDIRTTKTVHGSKLARHVIGLYGLSCLDDEGNHTTRDYIGKYYGERYTHRTYYNLNDLPDSICSYEGASFDETKSFKTYYPEHPSKIRVKGR